MCKLRKGVSKRREGFVRGGKMWQVEKTGGKLTKQVVSGGKGFVRRGKGFVSGGLGGRRRKGK